MQFNSGQILQRFETFRRNFVNFVVVEINVLQAVEKCRVQQLADLVEARVEGLEVEAGAERVVVADLIYLVVVDVQPLKRLRNEREIEPLSRTLKIKITFQELILFLTCI